MLVNGVVEAGTETRNLIFCTDDKHTSDILREGHISYNVNRAIELDLDPIQAIQMATLINRCKIIFTSAGILSRR